MVMDTVQVRLSHGLVDKIDDLVDTGIYTNRSDVIRDAVRKLVLEKMVGIVPNTGDSVKELREIKQRLSKEIKSFKDIEKINELIN
ncbi:MAG TPA: ribbon-helix-helix domain-containing protein [Candidatus Nanoarchaeia archaeon]|nr:ribbon-helix-helix domain-containing protein [Candidatus Nanoarchaeia archaeon]